ncbi:MAG TPA: dipeptide epimerase [Actinomycetota bacterium]|nr:dipeptide epimerase [Actinomycetota bacterium]
MSRLEMTLETEIRRLELAEPFTIATKTWEYAENVFVRLSSNGVQGIGEVSPEDRKGESAGGVVATLKGLDLSSVSGPFDLESIRRLLPAGSARCALDIAAHDLAAKTAGISVLELIGMAGARCPATSVTVPITEEAAMVARAGSFADHPVVKTKVGFEGDVHALERIREVFPGRIRIDANEGWDVDTAVRSLKAMEHLDIELCEQPIPAGNRDDLARVTESTSIPIYADEDVGTAADVAALANAVDGVNLKLRKTGGIREALHAIATARAIGLGVMIGCDLESGVATSAEAAVATLADHCDIDGPLLLAEDPFPTVRYERGEVLLPTGPGLGVVER